MTKAELVKKLEKAYEAEDLFPGVLGNPVTFAARWGLPLSKDYREFKERQLRAAKRRRKPTTAKNGASHSRRRKTVVR